MISAMYYPTTSCGNYMCHMISTFENPAIWQYSAWIHFKLLMVINSDFILNQSNYF